MPINSIPTLRLATAFEIHLAGIMSDHYQERVKALTEEANYKALLFLRQCYRQHKSVVTTKMIETYDNS